MNMDEESKHLNLSNFDEIVEIDNRLSEEMLEELEKFNENN